MAAFEHSSLKMTAKMDYDPEERSLVSKLTTLSIKVQDTGQIISEVEFDLAAFANQELYNQKLAMRDTIEMPSSDMIVVADGSSTSGNSLESLLMLTDDAYQAGIKANKKVASRIHKGK